jgi:hypothetical protein
MFIPSQSSQSIDPHVPSKIMILDDNDNNYKLTQIYNSNFFTDPLFIIYNIHKLFMKLKMYPKGTYIYTIGNNSFIGSESDMMSMNTKLKNNEKPLFAEIEFQDSVGTSIIKKDITELSIQYNNCLSYFTPIQFVNIMESIHSTRILPPYYNIKQLTIIRSSDLEELIFSGTDKINLKHEVSSSTEPIILHRDPKIITTESDY